MDTREKEKEFVEMYEKTADSMFRHCFFRIFDRETSKDLVQEAFMKVWKYMAEGSEINNLKAFLYKTLNNQIVDWARKKKAVSLEELEEKGFDLSFDDKSRMEKKIEFREILKLISRIQPNYREIILMRFVDDFSIEEIAEITGESKNNVSVLIHRGIEKIRELSHESK